MLHQLERVVLILVGDGLEEEPLQVSLEREVDHRLHGIDAALARDLRHRAVRPFSSVHDEDPFVLGGPWLGPDRTPLVALARGLDEAPAQLRVAQPLRLLHWRASSAR